MWKLLGLLLLVVLVLNACGPSTTQVAPGKQDRVFTIGAMDPMGGQAAFAYNEPMWGEQDAARWINEQGGINGVTVKVKSVDTRVDPALATSAYKKFVEIDKIFALTGHSTSEAMVLKPVASRDKVVMLAAAPSNVVWPAEGSYLFSETSNYAAGFEAALTWYLKNRWKENRPLKVALAAVDAGPGKECDVALKRAAPRLGLQYVGTVWVPPVTTDTTTQVLELKKMGPDVTFYVNIGVSLVSFMRDAYRLGLTKETQIIVPTFITQPWTVDATGIEAWQGVIGYTWLSLWTDDTKIVKLAKDNAAKYHPDWGPVDTLHERLTNYYFRGWALVYMYSEAFRRAMDKVGYDKVNGEELRKALETFKNFDTMGATAPVTFTPDNHVGSTAVRVVDLVPGKNYVRDLSGWIGIGRDWEPKEKTAEYWVEK